MDYFVYIIYSEILDSFYIGSTQDLPKRIEQHNNKSGSKFTKRSNDWKLMYYENFDQRSKAQKREYEIKKKKSRKYIEYLISKD